MLIIGEIDFFNALSLMTLPKEGDHVTANVIFILKFANMSRTRINLLRSKFNRRTIDTITFARGRRTIVKNMPKVSTTIGAK
jgi:hypothetical protein